MAVSGGNAVSRQDVYNSFRSQGLPHNQAANFAGVTSQEGGYKGGLYTGSFGGQPTERGGVLNPNGAYGIAQWNGPRQAGLVNYAEANGLQPYDLKAQTGFAVFEANKMGVDLNSTSSIVNKFEVPRADLRAGEIAKANVVASGFDPGSYTGQSTNGVNASSDGTVAAAGGSYQNFDANGNPTNADGSVASSEFPEIGTEGGSNSAVKNGGSASATGSQTGTPQQGNGGTSSSGGSGGASGFGFYMNEVARAIASALSPATQQAGKDVAKATDGVASATKESGTTVAKGSTDAAGITAAQSKANATLAADSTKDYFGRIVIILLGIIFVGGGVAMFVFNKNPIKIAKDLVT